MVITQNSLPKARILTDDVENIPILDFDQYRDAIVRLAKDSDPRFSIGIYGEWGTGKTTLMSMINRILDANKKIVTVWFNIWRHEREQYSAIIPFLRTLRLRLDDSEYLINKVGNWEIVKNGVERSAVAFLASTNLKYRNKDIVTAETDFARIADSYKEHGSVGLDVRTVYYHETGFPEKALT